MRQNFKLGASGARLKVALNANQTRMHAVATFICAPLINFDLQPQVTNLLRKRVKLKP